MTQEDWRGAYEPIPQALETRVAFALAHLESAPEKAPARGLSLRTVAFVLAVLLALCGAVYAVFESKTADIFGWFYGGSWKKELENGDFAPMGQSTRLGDVGYAIEEMVYKTEGDFQGLYGVVRISPAEGANVVLMPDDLSADDPAGVILHYGDVGQTIRDDMPSYAELAAQRGAKLLVARAAVNDIAVNGKTCAVDFGESWLPQADGTLLGTMEIAGDLPRAERYELNLWVSNWEAMRSDTRLQSDWNVTVMPETKGESAK